MLTTRSILTAGAATIALAAPPVAGAQSLDLRSPDAVDAGQTPQPAPRADFRSPDAVDAAGSASRITYVTPAPVEAGSGDGFAWGDAGIGAAGMLGVIGIVTGAGLLTVRRHRDDVALPTR
jgi:hypothetical protein